MTLTTEHLWEAFHTPLQQFIRQRVPDQASAEDILQEVFLKIHLSIDTLKEVKKLESWLYQITRHTIADYYRRLKPTVPLDVAEVLQMPEEAPDSDVITDLFPAVRAMVNGLPAQDRQALVLTAYQGLTQKELSERLGLSFSGAKSRVQRARDKLKQQLLACCHFEVDRRGHILGYHPHCHCCEQATCCDEGTGQPLRPFPKTPSL